MGRRRLQRLSMAALQGTLHGVLLYMLLGAVASTRQKDHPGPGINGTNVTGYHYSFAPPQVDGSTGGVVLDVVELARQKMVRERAAAGGPTFEAENPQAVAEMGRFTMDDLAGYAVPVTAQQEDAICRTQFPRCGYCTQQPPCVWCEETKQCRFGPALDAENGLMAVRALVAINMSYSDLEMYKPHLLDGEVRFEEGGQRMEMDVGNDECDNPISQSNTEAPGRMADAGGNDYTSNPTLYPPLAMEQRCMFDGQGKLTEPLLANYGMFPNMQLVSLLSIRRYEDYYMDPLPHWTPNIFPLRTVGDTFQRGTPPIDVVEVGRCTGDCTECSPGLPWPLTPEEAEANLVRACDWIDRASVPEQYGWQIPDLNSSAQTANMVYRVRLVNYTVIPSCRNLRYTPDQCARSTNITHDINNHTQAPVGRGGDVGEELVQKREVSMDEWGTCYHYLDSRYAANATKEPLPDAEHREWRPRRLEKDKTQITCCSVCCCGTARYRHEVPYAFSEFSQLPNLLTAEEIFDAAFSDHAVFDRTLPSFNSTLYPILRDYVSVCPGNASAIYDESHPCNSTRNHSNYHANFSHYNFSAPNSGIVDGRSTLCPSVSCDGVYCDADLVCPDITAYENDLTCPQFTCSGGANELGGNVYDQRPVVTSVYTSRTAGNDLVDVPVMETPSRTCNATTGDSEYVLLSPATINDMRSPVDFRAASGGGMSLYNIFLEGYYWEDSYVDRVNVSSGMDTAPPPNHRLTDIQKMLMEDGDDPDDWEVIDLDHVGYQHLQTDVKQAAADDTTVLVACSGGESRDPVTQQCRCPDYYSGMPACTTPVHDPFCDGLDTTTCIQIKTLLDACTVQEEDEIDMDCAQQGYDVHQCMRSGLLFRPRDFDQFNTLNESTMFRNNENYAAPNEGWAFTFPAGRHPVSSGRLADPSGRISCNASGMRVPCTGVKIYGNETKPAVPEEEALFQARFLTPEHVPPSQQTTWHAGTYRTVHESMNTGRMGIRNAHVGDYGAAEADLNLPLGGVSKVPLQEHLVTDDLLITLARRPVLHLARGVRYRLEAGYGEECVHITDVNECEGAALRLGLQDASATEMTGSTQDNWTWTSDVYRHEYQSEYQSPPPYCFVQAGQLMFNRDGTNAGPCRPDTRCICIDSVQDHADIRVAAEPLMPHAGPITDQRGWTEPLTLVCNKCIGTPEVKNKVCDERFLRHCHRLEGKTGHPLCNFCIPDALKETIITSNMQEDITERGGYFTTEKPLTAEEQAYQRIEWDDEAVETRTQIVKDDVGCHLVEEKIDAEIREHDGVCHVPNARCAGLQQAEEDNHPADKFGNGYKNFGPLRCPHVRHCCMTEVTVGSSSRTCSFEHQCDMSFKHPFEECGIYSTGCMPELYMCEFDYDTRTGNAICGMLDDQQHNPWLASPDRETKQMASNKRACAAPEWITDSLDPRHCVGNLPEGMGNPALPVRNADASINPASALSFLPRPWPDNQADYDRIRTQLATDTTTTSAIVQQWIQKWETDMATATIAGLLTTVLDEYGACNPNHPSTTNPTAPTPPPASELATLNALIDDLKVSGDAAGGRSHDNFCRSGQQSRLLGYCWWRDVVYRGQKMARYDAHKYDGEELVQTVRSVPAPDADGNYPVGEDGDATVDSSGNPIVWYGWLRPHRISAENEMEQYPSVPSVSTGDAGDSCRTELFSVCKSVVDGDKRDFFRRIASVITSGTTTTLSCDEMTYTPDSASKPETRITTAEALAQTVGDSQSASTYGFCTTEAEAQSNLNTFHYQGRNGQNLCKRYDESARYNAYHLSFCSQLFATPTPSPNTQYVPYAAGSEPTGWPETTYTTATADPEVAAWPTWREHLSWVLDAPSTGQVNPEVSSALFNNPPNPLVLQCGTVENAIRDSGQNLQQTQVSEYVYTAIDGTTQTFNADQQAGADLTGLTLTSGVCECVPLMTPSPTPAAYTGPLNAPQTWAPWAYTTTKAA